ncbi:MULTISPECIES: hypothetical protein [unclassified Microcoleus]|uniref:hypothetical protein n=1 Tax=unclassified Microcoleus TaxID=2642155 RepID=UPI002FCF9B99
MFQNLIQRFKVLIVAIALASCFVTLLPSAARAASSVALDTANELVNVVTVYPTTSKNQSEILAAKRRVRQAKNYESAIVIFSPDAPYNN